MYNKKENNMNSNNVDSLGIILDKLREANDKTGNKAVYYSNSVDGKNKRYYLKEIDMNFYKSPLHDKDYKEMYDKGSGKELFPRFFKDEKPMACKMQSLRSSSAMIFNTLGFDSHRVSIKSNNVGIPKGDYEINFEHKFEVLNNVEGKKFPANIDATLISNKLQTAILIESKMLEYMFYNDEIKIEKKYFDVEQYHNDTKEFCDVFKECRKHNFKFDYPQLLKHLIGFCNKSKTDYKNIKKIILVTVVWNILQPAVLFKNNKRQLNTYKLKWEKESNKSRLSEINESFSKIIKNKITFFKTNKINFEFKFFTYKDFLELIDYSKEAKRFKYLNIKYLI